MNDHRSRLIAALDVPDRQSALLAVDRLSGHVGCFKIGLELFSAEGPRLVEEIGDRGEKIFLDLKFHDIPNTVRGAVRSACRLGVHMLTVHASGGTEMLAAACREAQDSGRDTLVLAVTALTSLSDADVTGLGVAGPVAAWVEKLAGIAYGAGIRGLVASGRELPLLRLRFPRELRLVIPGIRPAAASTDDQARAVTPGDALRAGADYVVVGRPILQAADPAAAADAVVGEMADAVP